MEPVFSSSPCTTMELQRLREAHAELQKEVSRLKREMVEKDRLVSKLGEEHALAREEVTSKTKSVYQLQKQLRELEVSQESERTSNSSIFGTLLGVASGEAVELTKLRADFQVQNKELENKITENERLRQQLYDQQAEQEQTEASLSARFGEMSSRNDRLTHELSERSREIEVLKDQNEQMAEESLKLSDQHFKLTAEHSKMEDELCIAKHDLEMARAKHTLASNLLREQAVGESRTADHIQGEVKILVLHCHFWMKRLQQKLGDASPPVVFAAKSLVDMLARFQRLSLGEIRSEVKNIQRHVHMLGGIRSEFKTIASILSDESWSDPDVDCEPLLRRIPVDQLPVHSELGHALDSLQDVIWAMEYWRQQRVLEDKQIAEDSIAVVHSTSLPPAPQSTEEDESLAQIKRFYHERSMDLLQQLERCKSKLHVCEQRASRAEAHLKQATKQKEDQECRARKSQGDLDRSRQDFDEYQISLQEQLRVISERVVELEGVLTAKEEELTQIKGENLLIAQLAKSVSRG